MDTGEKVKEGWYIVTTSNQEQSVGYIRQKFSGELQIQYLNHKTCVFSLSSIHSLIEVDAEDIRQSYKKNKSSNTDYTVEAFKEFQGATNKDSSSSVNGMVITDDL